MSEIVNQWVQEKLGIIINLRPETFCHVTKDGFLLSKILRNYEIISEEQLKMIRKTDNREICLRNYQEHLINWLKIINIDLKNEEIEDIVQCRGLASISLFYRTFLELHEKDCLTFIAKNKLNQKLRPHISKFSVVNVKENPFHKLKKMENKYSGYIEHSYDVIHWLQDRFEMVISKCKNAREEYRCLARNSKRKISNNFSFPLTNYLLESNLENVSERTLHLTYDELLDENRKCRLKMFQPNPNEAKAVLDKIREKLKRKAENEIYRKELELCIRKSLWERILIQEKEDFHKEVTGKILKQSLYEKQMLSKLLEVKQQKTGMLKTKKIVTDEIVKENESLFIEKLLEKDETLKAKEFQYYLEKDRALRLHRTLYQEIQRIKEERRQTLCKDTVKAICDAAVKYSEYQELFAEPPPKHVIDTWNKIIILGQDIKTPRASARELIDNDTQLPEKIIQNDINMQDLLDEKCLESYLMFEWPWLLENIDVNEELVNDMKCGMNVLGHKVHLLLYEKYPQPLLPPPPNLPNVRIRVCVKGVPDITCLPMLTKLLSYKNVLVIQLQDATNYCIEAFKIESITEVEEDTKNDEDEEESKKEKKQKSRKGKKEKAKKKPKLDVSMTTPTMDKRVQTPRIYPCERIYFSPQAELGKIADEELAKGNALTDYLLVSMFLEYLRSRPDIEGWVLINYPMNFEQAILLEEGLSGLTVPGVAPSNKICKSLIDIVQCISEQDDSVPEVNDLRYSKLVIDPTEPPEPPPYDTMITAFIQICPDEDLVESIQSSDVSIQDEDSEKLNEFYSDMGCLYSLYYKSFEYSTVKRLGKLIIGDFSIPPKSSVELFGDTVHYIEVDKLVDYRNSKYVLSGDKVERERIEKVVKKAEAPENVSESEVEEKGKKGKKDKKDKKGRKEKKSKKGVIIVHEDKSTQIPEVTIIELEEEEETKEEAKPGEPGWIYLNLKLSDKIGGIVTDIWEYLEEVFLNDMSQVLFMKSTFLNSLMPYICYIRELMNKHISKPDDRQIYVLKFQENFNQFDYDFRRDSEFKAELHCLINELKNKLFDISDRKMMATEQERHTLIYQGWGPRQLIEIINNYISGFQLELDRHIDTLEFINDYFNGLITQVLGEDLISKDSIPKFELENQFIHKIVNNCLIETTNDNVDKTLREIRDKIRTIYQTAQMFAQKRDNIAFALFDKVKLLFCPEATKGKGKPKSKKSGKGTKTILTVFEPSENIKRNQDKIFDEWLCTLKGEIARTEIYFQLLQHDMFENVDLFINTIKKVFFSIFENIRTRYEKEVKCIKTACYIFSAAVEREVPIQEELRLTDDDFLIDAENIWFEPPPPEKVKELPSDLIFTTKQLLDLIEIFHDLAVDGFIPNKMFTFILQDIVVNEEINIAPAQWRKLTGRNVTELSRRIFNNQKYIHWKDFIIYNLTVKIPSCEDIIKLRNQFLYFDPHCTELIDKVCYQKIQFWFEEGSENIDELWTIKNLLFEMYRTGQQFCNYTAMLLDFCKGECTQEGIAKALAVIGGKAVCWDKEIGKLFVEETIIKREIHEKEVKLREEEIEANKEFARSIIDKIIDTTVHTCDSVVITEEANEVVESNNEENKEVANQEEKTKMEIENEEVVNENIEIVSEDQKEKQEPEPLVPVKKKSLKIKKFVQKYNDSTIDKEELLTVQNIDSSKTENITNEVSSETSVVEPKFSNISIGFEPQSSPPLRYFLLFEDIATVLIKTLSDVLTSEDKQFFDIVCEIYQHCMNREFNKQVFCHEFLNDKKFLELMEGKTKFILKVPGRIVEDMLVELRLNPHKI